MDGWRCVPVAVGRVVLTMPNYGLFGADCFAIKNVPRETPKIPTG